MPFSPPFFVFLWIMWFCCLVVLWSCCLLVCSCNNETKHSTKQQNNQTTKQTSFIKKKAADNVRNQSLLSMISHIIGCFRRIFSLSGQSCQPHCSCRLQCCKHFVGKQSEICDTSNSISIVFIPMVYRNISSFIQFQTIRILFSIRVTTQ